MRLRRLARRAAEAAIAAAERGLRYRGDRLPGRFVRHLAFAEHQRAFAEAFIDHLDNTQSADHGSLCRQWTMQRDALLAIDDLEPIDPSVAFARPKAGMTKDGPHGRQHFQILLAYEWEIVLVHRILGN